MATSIGQLHARLAINIPVEVGREEYLDYMTFQALTPPQFTEIFGPIVGLKEEWAAQGASPDELDMSAFRYRRAADAYLPASAGFRGGQPEEIVEETDEVIIARDARGRLTKLIKQTATLPLPLEYPVSNMDEWLKLKHHYEYTDERLAADWEGAAKKALEAGRCVTVSLPGAFAEPRELMGDEELCLAYYDQPELVHDILDTIADTAFRVLETVSAAVQVDKLSIHEDLAGKSGPLLGPKQMDEFLIPHYRRVWDMLRDRGARLCMVDTDGNVDAIIPHFIKAGVNLLYPMEPAAGMDIVRLREEYGTQLAFMGGLDKHVIRKSKEEIVAELEYKIPPMVRTGGCVLGLDHRIPNGSPLEHYRFYNMKAWEIMEREAAELGLQ